MTSDVPSAEPTSDVLTLRRRRPRPDVCVTRAEITRLMPRLCSSPPPDSPPPCRQFFLLISPPFSHLFFWGGGSLHLSECDSSRQQREETELKKMFTSGGILHVLMYSFKGTDTVARGEKKSLIYHTIKQRNEGRTGVDCERADNGVTDGFLHFILRCGA